ncbi:unnamed protein product, partial [marine sediment metagenome]
PGVAPTCSVLEQEHETQMTHGQEGGMKEESMANKNLVGLAVASNLARIAGAPYADHQIIANLIHDALLQAGLGQIDSEVPLADIIKPGMTVLLKPNWVLHYNQGGYGMECMVTQPEFLLAVLREVVAAKPGRVILGDAPIQGCKWDELVTDDFQQAVIQLAPCCKVEFIDFRRTILRKGSLVEGVQIDAREQDKYILFDLGPDSLLEPISVPPGRFRVTMYDPDKLAMTHCPGRHQYLLCREAFEANVILNLPK